MSSIKKEWIRIIYRGVRTAVASGLALAWATKVDWTNLEDALKVVGGAFLSGFIVSLGMWLRDILDSEFGFGEKSLLNRIIPV